MATRDGLAAKAARSVIWVMAEKWGSRVVSLVVFALLGRLLSPHDFGLVALTAVFTTILSLFVDSGFSQVLVQRRKVSSVQVATAFWTSVLISLALYLLICSLAGPIAGAYGEPQLQALLCVLGLQLPITALSSTPAALLERDFAFRTLALRQLSGVVVGAIGGVAAAVGGLGVWALVIQTLLGACVSSLVLWFKSEWRPTFEYSLSELTGMARLGLYVLGTEAVNLVNTQADKLIVGIVLGPTALGYYYVASRILILVSDSVSVVIAEVSFTTFSRLQDDPARLVRVYNRVTFVSACVALPAFGALAVVAPVLIPLLFGAQWSASVLLMQLLAPAIALQSIQYFDKSALLARGFGRDTLLIALANMVLGLGMVLAATPWGAIGIAVSRSVRQLVFWPVRLAVLRYRLGLVVPTYLGQFTKPFLATLVTMGAMVLAAQLLPDQDALRLVVQGVVGVLTFAGGMMLVARTEMLDIFRLVSSRGQGEATSEGPAPVVARAVNEVGP